MQYDVLTEACSHPTMERQYVRSHRLLVQLATANRYRALTKIHLCPEGISKGIDIPNVGKRQWCYGHLSGPFACGLDAASDLRPSEAASLCLLIVDEHGRRDVEKRGQRLDVRQGQGAFAGQHLRHDGLGGEHWADQILLP